MNNLYLMWIKTPFRDETTKFSKGDVFLVGKNSAKSYQDQFQRWGKPNAAEFYKITEFFKSYDSKTDSACQKLVVRSGGIGDIIALSTICDQIPGKIRFLTQSKYKSIFQFYNKPVEFVDYTKAIFTGVNFAKLNELHRNTRIVNFNDAIENGSDKNWYRIFYESINMDVNEDRCRPELKDLHIERDDSILICHRSTANMRSAPFELFYRAVVEAGFEQPIYVHDSNLTETDRKFLNLMLESVHIIHADTTEDYLIDVATFGLVISVDSAALHMREGLGLPAIGVYNSFTAKSRTEGYKHTYSFDIKGSCPMQPCFLHQSMPGSNKVINNCEYGDGLSMDVAPCFIGTKDQLVKHFKQYNMYIANYLKEVEPGVFIRENQNEAANCVYELTDELKAKVEQVLNADKVHYDNMAKHVKEHIPDLFGKYKKVTSIGGGLPKFEHCILGAESVNVVDMNTELYKLMEEKFREIYGCSMAVKYTNKVLTKPYGPKTDCVTFVHFLEHMPDFEIVKAWINAQTTDIVIYMPCIEAAENINWWHYNDQHNTFFTVAAIKKVGELAGYSCEAMRYSDDMLIWFKK